MKILGLSCFYHDSAASLVIDGQIIAAAQQERFSRKKHDEAFPTGAIQYCLRQGNLKLQDIDYIAYYEKPLLKFERLLETYLAFAPRGLESFLTAMPVWMKEKLFIKKTLQDELGQIDETKFQGKILFTEHHEAHAASAFYPSPFDQAAIMTIDGVGEWATTSLGIGKGNSIQLLKEINFPHSLGLLYSAFTYYTGFKVNSGEYKVMGLAPYGQPTYVETIKRHLIDIKDDGSFRLNMDYFDYCTGLTMTNEKFRALFGGPARKPESKVTQKDMDLARSIQVITEEIMLKMANYLHAQTGLQHLCLAGGVALNCVANGKILREGPYQSIWIQPAAGDAGGALGAALAVWYRYLNNKRSPKNKDSMQGAYLGPGFDDVSMKNFLTSRHLPSVHFDQEEKLVEKVAHLMADEKIVGWLNGRMEFGPRALGGRSILGDARSPKMQSVMNLKIKFRESFRPFAPSVLRERVSDYFELNTDSPYMLLVADVQKKRRKNLKKEQENLWGIDLLNVPKSDIPAVTHVDYSARIQTVHKATNPRYWKLLRAFEKQTSCPVIVNTSFNVRGEPIVCTPEDAYKCFMRTEMDYLVLGNYLLDKKDQPTWREAKNWRDEYGLD